MTKNAKTIKEKWEEILFEIKDNNPDVVSDIIIKTWVKPLKIKNVIHGEACFLANKKHGKHEADYLKRKGLDQLLLKVLQKMVDEKISSVVILDPEDDREKMMKHLMAKEDSRDSRDLRRKQKVAKTNTAIQEAIYRLSRHCFNMLNYGFSQIKTFEITEDGQVVGLSKDKINAHVRIVTKEYCADMLMPLEGGSARKQLMKYLDGIDHERFWLWNEETRTYDKFAWISNIRIGKGYFEWDFTEDAVQFLAEHGKKNPYSSYEISQLSFFKGEYTGRLFDFFNSYKDLGYVKVSYVKLRNLLNLEDNEYPEYRYFTNRIIKPSLDEIKQEAEDFYVINETPRNGNKPVEILYFRIVKKEQKEKEVIHYRHVREINRFEAKHLTKDKMKDDMILESDQMTLSFTGNEVTVSPPKDENEIESEP